MTVSAKLLLHFLGESTNNRAVKHELLMGPVEIIHGCHALRITRGNRVIRLRETFLLADWSRHFSLETGHCLFDRQLTRRGFTMANEEAVDSGAAECRAERIEHGSDFNMGHCVCLVGVVLPQVMSPEMLPEHIIWLILGPARGVRGK